MGGTSAWLEVARQIGFTGVDVFFVSSGYVMWLVSARDRGGRDAVAFCARRFSRIYTGYWPAFALTLACCSSSRR